MDFHSDQPPPNIARVQAAVRALVLQLSEFGDVQVLLSYVDSDDNTIDIVEGRGNWNARRCMAMNFVDNFDRYSETACDSEEAMDDDDDDFELH